MSTALSAMIAGLLTGLSLIVAIGAQNAYVLRQGLARQHVTAVVAVCAISDLVLIVAGVAGLGAVVTAQPGLLVAMGLGGGAFLLAYGVRAAVSAVRPQSMPTDGSATVALGAAVATAVALTWLNPHVYLDTVLLLGSVAAGHGSAGRWWFAAGAGVASIAWFTALGYGSRHLRRFFSAPRSWRILDLVIAVVMITLGTVLIVGVLR